VQPKAMNAQYNTRNSYTKNNITAYTNVKIMQDNDNTAPITDC